MRFDLIKRLQRIFILISLLLLSAMVFLVAGAAGYSLPWPEALVGALFPATGRERVALVSGHAGYDSGAICGDPQSPALTEAEVNARVAELTAQELRRAGVDVLVLDEYDERLDNLSADVLLSLHVDSCIDASGYKAAHRINSPIPEQEDRLLACIHQEYPRQTGLRYHPETVTHDMTAYHAFRKILPTTPAAILEMGFLGGDGALLTGEPQRVARGVADSLLCFLHGAEKGPPPPDAGT